MNIIDHRILIPKSPETVWQYISDLTKNTAWQVDCEKVSILTTSHLTGPGVRWRYTTTSGREYVAETTAWYDKLGYEYKFVDGSPFRESLGRIRLQDIAEGTIVQWTFSYDLGGILGGVRNAIGTKRQVENVMMESLRTLWKVIQQTAPDEKHAPKSAMRDAPDYEGRMQYKPRHPSNKPVEPDMVFKPPTRIPEPPVAEDDTRPRRPVVVDEPQPVVTVTTPEPVLPVVVDAVEKLTPVAEEKPVVLPVPEPAKVTETVEKVPAQPPEELAREVVEFAIPVPSEDISAHKPTSFTATETRLQETAPLAKYANTDTAEISVFELFGLPKPSETQEMRAITATLDELESVVAVPTVEKIAISAPELFPQRIGLRIIQRRKRANVRRPGSSH